MANQHVVPNGNNGWKILGEGNERATKITKTQQEAIKIARQIAKNQKSELIIHDKNGKIRDKDSYGNDPIPPRDRIF